MSAKLNQGYNKEYYKQNRNKILEYRRKKYLSDKKYKDGIVGRANIDQKILTLRGPIYPMVKVKGQLEQSYSLFSMRPFITRGYWSLLRLAKYGCIPKPLWKNTQTGLYSESQKNLLGYIMAEISENPSWIPKCGELYNLLNRFWNTKFNQKLVQYAIITRRKYGTIKTKRNSSSKSLKENSNTRD